MKKSKELIFSIMKERIGNKPGYIIEEEEYKVMLFNSRDSKLWRKGAIKYDGMIIETFNERAGNKLYLVDFRDKYNFTEIDKAHRSLDARQDYWWDRLGDDIPVLKYAMHWRDKDGQFAEEPIVIREIGRRYCTPTKLKERPKFWEGN